MGTKRDIYNYLGVKIGELELPNSTSEDEWAAKLAEYALPPENPMIKYLTTAIKDRREYADNLIERFKLANMESGVNAAQALWLQHRMRALEINFNGLPLVIDMMNLIISGDAEVACLALLYAVPDDMSQPYHYFSADRKAWLVNDLKNYLGWA